MDSVPAERWKPVVGYESLYEISSDGRVRSLPRRGTKGKVLAERIESTGYHQVRIRYGSGEIHRMAHRLVAEAFIGPIPDGMWVNHKDGNKRNNRVENLELVTPGDNQRHAYETGLRVATPRRGMLNNWAKLTDDIIRDIRVKYAKGMRQKDISMATGVDFRQVHCIVKRKTWAHVTD